MDAPWHIRSAVPTDGAALAALERRCFSDPWSERSFGEALVVSSTFVLVAEGVRGGVAGYFVGHVAVGSAEVLNLAVAPEARRRGLGRELLEAGLLELAARGADEVFLEVRESNLAAQALYRDYGFVEVGRRRDYYTRPRESALVLRLDARDAAKR
jgi:ribosomal-protein-alanine N-acetyltransferase